MTALIKDLINIPERVHKGDFVLKLSESVQHPKETLDAYVVTPQLLSCFENALSFIESAVSTRTSKAAYLHGSFGAGKSHFMAVLHLLLQNHAEARSRAEFAPLLNKHAWIQGKKFLLVPYHMIGAKSMESAILGGYARFVEQNFPEAPRPGVFLADELFANADRLRKDLGDTRFFARLNEASGNTGWGEMDAGWDATTYQQARETPDARARLVGDLVGTHFPAYAKMARAEGEGYVPLDEGLAILSAHAKNLGYHGLILFLDELVLWLATNCANLAFVQSEGQKLVKLVEAESAERPIPIISFVARQRDLRDLVGEHVTGSELLNFSDVLKHWEGRFHKIVLEDRNLHEIAEKRVLRPRSPQARIQLDEEFDRTSRLKDSVINVLLTSQADKAMFRKVYPFSPALVQTLVSVSSVLQRERTALKIMMELLVEQRDTLSLGQIIPVGDLFDIVSMGDEVITGIMGSAFENARKLYRQRLLPLLHETNEVPLGITDDELRQDEALAGRYKNLQNEARLLKTLLLAAIVPEVESLKNLTPQKLAALNYGTIKSPIPGAEGRVIQTKLATWCARVGEIKLSGDPGNPFVSIQLTGVDTEAIINQAREDADNLGNRRRRVKETLFALLGLKDTDDPAIACEMLWKGTKRSFQVVWTRVRDLSSAALGNEGETWKVVIEAPFDDGGQSPRDALRRLERYQDEGGLPTRTLAWIPSFFSASLKNDLSTLVALDHILTGDRAREYTGHLAPETRETARTLLQNRRDSLHEKLKLAIAMAYGLGGSLPDALDGTHTLAPSEQFVSLYPGFDPRPPAASDPGAALRELMAQALSFQYPRHPDFNSKDEIKVSLIKQVWQQLERAFEAPGGRIEIEKAFRERMKDVAEGLNIGKMGDTHFHLQKEWVTEFNKRVAESGQDAISVSQLYRWMDEPQPMGLPALLRNLVVLLYARQTLRTFYAYGTARDPEVEGVRPEMELREQTLPDASLWESACQVASELIAQTPARTRNAANVEALVKSLREWAARVRPSNTRALEAVKATCDAVGVAYDESERIATARQTQALFQQLKDASAEAMLQALVDGTSARPLAHQVRALQAAEAIAAALDADTLTALGSLPSVEDPDARQTLRTLQDALRHDEFSVPLAGAAADAKSAAIRAMRAEAERQATLRRKAEEEEKRKRETTRPRKEQLPRQKQMDSVDAARSFLADIEAATGGQDVSIEITWTVKVKP